MNCSEVLIRITPDGWETTVTLKDLPDSFIEKHERTVFGSRSIVGDFENEDGITDELYDALNSTDCFDIMQALYEHDRTIIDTEEREQ